MPTLTPLAPPMIPPNAPARTGRAPRVLLVEDNPAHAQVIRDALRGSVARHQLSVASDGAEALAVLRQARSAADADWPSLILLNRTLPRTDGRQVLAEIKSDPALRTIPVVVLCDTGAMKDIRLSYDLHANCVVVKPADPTALAALARSIVDFWLTTPILPPIPRRAA